MAKKVKSFRLDTELIAWVDSYAAERKATQAAVVEEALRSFRAESECGVPDLPVEAAAPAYSSSQSEELLRRALADGRAEYARNIAVRQRKLNEAKERASR